jgi:hypothetical protein
MGIRGQAEQDAALILGASESGDPFVLVNMQGNEFPVSGHFGDIGLLLDPETGASVQGQTASVAYSMKALKAQTDEVPERGWKVKNFDFAGAERTFYVVRPPIQDFTIGITRLMLGVNL